MAQHFIEFLPYMYKTADVSYWGIHADATCEDCVKILANIEEMKMKGEWIDGNISINDFVVEDPVDDSGDYQIHFLLTRKGVVVHQDDELTFLDDRTFYGKLRVGLRKSVWKVLEFKDGKAEKFDEVKTKLLG